MVLPDLEMVQEIVVYPATADKIKPPTRCIWTRMHYPKFFEAVTDSAIKPMHLTLFLSFFLPLMFFLPLVTLFKGSRCARYSASWETCCDMTAIHLLPSLHWPVHITPKHPTLLIAYNNLSKGPPDFVT